MSKNKKTYVKRSAFNKYWAIVIALIFALVGGVVVWRSFAETYTASNFTPVGIASNHTDNGYWLVASDGGVFSYGSAHFYGSMGGKALNAPVVGIASTPDGGGYWLVGSDGGIFSFGDAHYYGSMGGKTLSKPIVGMASTPDGGGYWLVGSDGAVYAFGDAKYEGGVNSPASATSPLATAYGEGVVGISSTTTGDDGYYIVSNFGEVWAYGNAPGSGQNGCLVVSRRGSPYIYGQSYVQNPLVDPVVGIATDPSGGIWTVDSNGGVFSYNGATYYGSMGGKTLNKPMVGIAPASDGGGYWLTAGDGGVFAFGSSQYQGRVYYGSTSTTGSTSTSSTSSSSSNSGSPTKSKPGSTTTQTVNGTTVTYVNGNPVSSGTVSASASGYLNPTEAKIPRANAPIVSGMATSNNGYWLEGADGGIFSEGSAQYHGSMGGKTLNAQIVGMAKTKDGGGYWLVGSDGGVFSFGDAHYYGSLGGDTNLVGWVTSISPTPNDNGYYLFGSDGGVFGFGSAKYEGRVVYPPPSLTMTATPSLIQLGQSTTLSWSTTNSDLATIEVEGSQVHGPFGSSGSVSLTPTSYGTYNYKLIVIGAGGYVTKSVTLNVLPPKPTAQISANFYNVPLGGVSRICWSTSWAGSVSISLLGNVATNGCEVKTFTTIGKQSLTITAVGYGGTTTYTDPQPIVVYTPSSSGSDSLSYTAASGSSTINIPSVPSPGAFQQLLIAPLGKIYITSGSQNNYSTGTFSTTNIDFVCFDFNYDNKSDIKGSFSLNYRYDYQLWHGNSGSFSVNETDYLNTNHIVTTNKTGTDCEPLEIVNGNNQIGIINFDYEYQGLPTGISFRGVRLIGGSSTSIKNWSGTGGIIL